MMTASAHLETLRAAVEVAASNWYGMTWDSGLAGLGDRIREDKRIDVAEIGSWRIQDGSLASQEHHEELTRLRRLIERDERDAASGVYGSDVTERAAELAEQLAAEEDAYVTARADSAAEQGALAVEAAEAGDLDEALRLAREAATIEREFGGAPAWGGIAGIVERMIAETAGARGAR